MIIEAIVNSLVNIWILGILLCLGVTTAYGIIEKGFRNNRKYLFVCLWVSFTWPITLPILIYYEDQE